MKKYLALLLSVVLLFCFAACGSELNSEQKQACDTADKSLKNFVDDFNDYFGEVVIKAESERKMVSDTALYIVHLRFTDMEAEDISSSLAQATYSDLNSEVSDIISAADVHLVVYIYGTGSESEYRLVADSIPSSVVSKLD